MKSYRTKQALAHLRGFGYPGNDITQSQLVHWAERGVVKPSIQDAAGYSSYREYAFKDLVKAAIVSRLLSIGMDLREVESAFEDMEENFAYDDQGRYKDLWQALKENPRKFSFFYMRTMQGKNDTFGLRYTGYDFSEDAYAALFADSERLKNQDPPTLIVSARIINISEIVEVLKDRTGDGF